MEDLEVAGKPAVRHIALAMFKDTLTPGGKHNVPASKLVEGLMLLMLKVVARDRDRSTSVPYVPCGMIAVELELANDEEVEKEDDVMHRMATP